MPVRFRCASCDRMLSIARRKSGTVVNCPTCQAELIVPTEMVATVRVDGNGPPAAPPDPPTQRPKKKKSRPVDPPPDFGPPPTSMPLFERPDFEALLSPVAGSASQPVLAQPAAPARATPAAPPPPMPLPVARSDEPDVVLVSRGNLTLVAVVMVVLVGLAFAAGYIIAAVTLTADKAA